MTFFDISNDPPNGSSSSLPCLLLVFKTAVVFVFKDSSKHRKKIVSTVFLVVYVLKGEAVNV